MDRENMQQMPMRGQGGGPGQQQEQQKAEAEAKARKEAILSQILDQSARARLNTLILGKPEKGQLVEQLLLQNATSGQIQRKITESELIGLLESMNTGFSKPKTTVKFDRRRTAIDSDDDDF